MLMIRIPAAFAALAAAAVAVLFGAPLSAPSETTIMTVVAEGLWRALVSSCCAAAIPAPMYEAPPGMMLSTTALACTPFVVRSEEHTSELQSHLNLVCRLLLEKKKKTRD